MKTTTWMATIVAISISGPVFAWTSTFYDRMNGGSFTYANAESPEDAQRLALQGCRAKASDAECVEMGRPLRSTTIVIARGTQSSADDVSYRSGDPDSDKAARQALSNCRKEAKDCHLELATWDEGFSWAALATNPEGTMFLNYNAETRETAETGAIRGCEEKAPNKGSCKVRTDLVTGNRAWIAFARSESYFSFGVSDYSEQQAKQNAMDFCNKGAKGNPCRVTEVNENPGSKPAPPSFTKLKARIEREEAQRNAAAPKKVAANPAPNGNGECRPQGNTIRCTSQCSNGNCIVTYENGCKIRVQVQPRFNPFNNQWDYPAPSC